MAGDTADTTTVAYSGVFDPVWYMDTYYNSVTFESDEDKLLQFYIEKYHDIKQSGGVTGGSLLDVGTGPSIHSIISACRHVDDVYLSDFTPQNRRVLADWWKSDKLSIENVTEYILKLENSRQTAAERQEMMKEKVRDILPIDITLPKPIGSGCDVTQFDVITSSLCLESAAQTLDQYRSNAGNVSSLLKSGGHLILNGVLENSWYRVGQSKFQCVKTTDNQIKSIFVNYGFEIRHFEAVRERSTADEYSDCVCYFIMHAVKK